MTLPARVTVSVPGSSANLGPGFDCLGVALPLRLTVTVVRRPGPLAVHLSGEGRRRAAGRRLEPRRAPPSSTAATATASPSRSPTSCRSRRAAARPRRRSWPGLATCDALRRPADRPRGPEPPRGRDRGAPRQHRGGRLRRLHDRHRRPADGAPDRAAARARVRAGRAAGAARHLRRPRRAGRAGAAGRRRPQRPAGRAARLVALHRQRRRPLGGTVRPAPPGRPRAPRADVRAPVACWPTASTRSA